MESRNPQKVIRVTLWENYGKIGKVLVNLYKMCGFGHAFDSAGGTILQVRIPIKHFLRTEQNPAEFLIPINGDLFCSRGNPYTLAFHSCHTFSFHFIQNSLSHGKHNKSFSKVNPKGVTFGENIQYYTYIMRRRLLCG